MEVAAAEEGWALKRVREEEREGGGEIGERGQGEKGWWLVRWSWW